MDQIQLIRSITRQILSCKHEIQIETVRNVIDNADLPLEAKKVLYEHCNEKERNLPTIEMIQVKHWPSFARTAGIKIGFPILK